MSHQPEPGLFSRLGHAPRRVSEYNNAPMDTSYKRKRGECASFQERHDTTVESVAPSINFTSRVWHLFPQIPLQIRNPHDAHRPAHPARIPRNDAGRSPEGTDKRRMGVYAAIAPSSPSPWSNSATKMIASARKVLIQWVFLSFGSHGGQSTVTCDLEGNCHLTPT
ncbi:hypothetical protein B0H10DRAFT_1968267 [Mycena sp. CBHHK59/15]|nr:hypothetical protein B0H10DRAFT_1968267 [Mycena sp. CBHHK59/15]